MEVKNRQELLKKALIESFVDEYKIYRKTLDSINKYFNDYNIDFQYTYDDFCSEFLNHSMKNIEHIDIFSIEQYNQFYLRLLQFNLYILQVMLTDKIEKLGYDINTISNRIGDIDI